MSNQQPPQNGGMPPQGMPYQQPPQNGGNPYQQMPPQGEQPKPKTPWYKNKWIMGPIAALLLIGVIGYIVDPEGPERREAEREAQRQAEIEAVESEAAAAEAAKEAEEAAELEAINKRCGQAIEEFKAKWLAGHAVEDPKEFAERQYGGHTLDNPLYAIQMDSWEVTKCGEYSMDIEVKFDEILTEKSGKKVAVDIAVFVGDDFDNPRLGTVVVEGKDGQHFYH